ncbi:MAG TPA: hypothetical protein GX524_04690 [Firmicutes bacterium]|nr:hypothetical protein [Bacillota bacterium]
MKLRSWCFKAIKCGFILGVITGKKELCFRMKNRTFWDGLAVGAIAGMVLGLAVLSRERMTPMEQTKMAMGRSARRAWRRAQGSVGRMVGRFSG